MKKRLLIRIVFVFVLGIAFISMGYFGNEYFYSIGIAMIAVGIAKAIRYYLMAKDEEKMKEYETKVNDERNRYVAQKAYGTAFWVSVYGEWIGSLVLTYLNHSGAEILSLLVCAQILVYIAFYFIYSRKY